MKAESVDAAGARLRAAGWRRVFVPMTAGPQSNDDDGVRWRSPADRVYTEDEALKRLNWDTKREES